MKNKLVKVRLKRNTVSSLCWKIVGFQDFLGYLLAVCALFAALRGTI